MRAIPGFLAGNSKPCFRKTQQRGFSYNLVSMGKQCEPVSTEEIPTSPRAAKVPDDRSQIGVTWSPASKCAATLTALMESPLYSCPESPPLSPAAIPGPAVDEVEGATLGLPHVLSLPVPQADQDLACLTGAAHFCCSQLNKTGQSPARKSSRNPGSQRVPVREHTWAPQAAGLLHPLQSCLYTLLKRQYHLVTEESR
jgi:hypothetical protein